MQGQRILFLMTGSIAAYKACQVLSRLKQAGADIEVVASPSCLKFIGRATIEGLIGKNIHSDLFGPGAHMAHIHLSRWADLTIICPATANTANKLANGVGDDLITTLFLAHDFSTPWLLAPAMNAKMYHHPVTRSSFEKLTDMGCEVLETASGVLACGEVGDGKLLEPDLIFKEIQDRLKLISAGPRKSEPTVPIDQSMRFKPGGGLSILVTSGGAREPIDAVRSITNASTGETGRQIAEAFLGLGHQVYFLSSKNGALPEAIALGAEHRLKVMTYDTYQDLRDQLRDVLSQVSFDWVVHAAAVSDYSVADGANVAQAKMDTSADLTLQLKLNPKLIDFIGEWSKSKSIRIVGFKLTVGLTPQERVDKVARAARSKGVCYVVENDMTRLPEWNLYQTNNGDPKVIASGNDRTALGLQLESLCVREGMEKTT